MRPDKKDILRTIRKEKKRFIAISVIAMLGISMFSGMKASCDDLRKTADDFFDEQNLHDIYIQSTLGLTQDDVDAITELDDIDQITGFYSEEVETMVGENTKTALIKVLDLKNGMDAPSLLEGAMPAAADEILVTENYLAETNKQIGDTLEFTETDLEDDDEDADEESEETEEATDEIVAEIGDGEVVDADADTEDAEAAENESDAEEEDDDDDFTIDESKYEIEEEEETPTFANTTFKIVGVVVDPTDINAAEGSTEFRSTATYDYIWFVTPDAAETEIYTSIGITVTGLKDLFCFDEEYESRVRLISNTIADTLKETREVARTEQVKGEANETIDKAENTMKDAFNEADEKFADAQQELEDGEKELADAQQELDDSLKDGKSQIADGRKQLDAAQAELSAGSAQLASSEAEIAQAERDIASQESLLKSKEAELKSAESQIKAGYSELNSAQSQIDAARSQLNSQKAQVDSQWASFQANKQYMSEEEIADTEFQLMDASEEIEAAKAELNSREAQIDSERANLDLKADEVNEGWAAIESGKNQLELAKDEIAAAKRKIQSGKAEISSGQAEINKNRDKLNSEESNMYSQIADAQAEINDGRQELEDGRAEYDENWDEYQTKKSDAEAKIADARQEVEDIKDAQWYIQNRYGMSGYSNVKNDSSAIESLGTVFAIIFLIVAVLISLTTITRMVEEERGLIGAYQALGYYNREIRRKYVSFALLACLLGCLLGEALGYFGFPIILGSYFGTMYMLPEMTLAIDWPYLFLGMGIFIGCIAVAVLTTCRGTLRNTPATLMRPKAPKAGSRVFLEYIPFIWKNMSFLNKVTARNLFRYKKRLIMTVFGIAGCTAILLSSFGLKDTMLDLMNLQYGDITKYSWLVVVDSSDKEDLDADLDAEESVISYLGLDIESVSLVNEAGESMTISMYVVPDDANLTDYIRVDDVSTGKPLTLDNSGVIITANAGVMLGIKAGDEVTIQDSQFYTYKFNVSAIALNYLGNSIFMTESLFEETFEDYAANANLVNLNENGQSFIDVEAEKKMILSSASTQALKDDFQQSFAMLNVVVYLMICMAAALAFVVLFTLSTTNISERERELATIKVLGFFNREVHTYVNKETIILALIGIAIGLPLGDGMMTVQSGMLKMSNLYMVPSVHQISYAYSAILAFVFTLVVNLLTNRTLNKIDPVEALKSIE